MKSAEYIRTHYAVPAKVGMRVTFTEPGKPSRQATIVGYRNAYLRLRFDGERRAVNAHPTYGITYPELTADLAARFTPAERLAVALARKEATLDAIVAASKWDQYVTEQAVLLYGLNHESWSCNQLRELLPAQGRGFLGAAINSLNGAGIIEHADAMVASDLDGTNGHRIFYWRLTAKGQRIAASRRDHGAQQRRAA